MYSLSQDLKTKNVSEVKYGSPTLFDFTAENMPYLRQKMMFEVSLMIQYLSHPSLVAFLSPRAARFS
jgi:hypothetical protein